MDTYDKDPDDVLDFQFNWEAWLDGDTINTSSWKVPDGLTKGNVSNTDTTATVWLSGGTAGVTYRVTNHIITAAGREVDRTILISVKER